MLKKLVIIGAGGVGREIAATLKNAAFSNFKLIGYIDDGKAPGTIINTVPVLGGIDWLLTNNEGYSAVIAIGNPQVRKKIIERLEPAALEYPTLVHPGARLHDNNTIMIGKGCYIADGCIFTTDIIVEDFCFINTACSLQHDSHIGKNSVLMPGVRITGGAFIGANSYIGANYLISTAVRLDENSVVEMSKL